MQLTGKEITGGAYEIEVESKKYQVEVQLLENTNAYVHVVVEVDDGSLPPSITPLTRTFIRQKGDTDVEERGAKL